MFEERLINKYMWKTFTHHKAAEAFICNGNPHEWSVFISGLVLLGSLKQNFGISI